MDYDKLAGEIKGKSKTIDYDTLANEVVQKKPASFIKRVGSGMVDPVVGLNQLMYNALPDVGQRGVHYVTNKAAEFVIGTPMPEGGYNEFVQKREQAIQKEAPEGVNWARVLGNVASPVNALPAAAGTRIAATAGGRMAQGRGWGSFGGATEPVSSGNYEEQLAKNTALGAALGLGGSGLIETASRVVSPRASIDPAIRELKKAVNLTPGQAAGGAFTRLEEKLSSVPVLGDMIAARRSDSVKQFNQSMLNKAGKSIGFKTEKTGVDAITELDDAVSAAYSRAADETKGVTIDQGFQDVAAKLSDMAQFVPDNDATKKVIDRLIDRVYTQTSEAGKILPETWKQLDSQIGTIANKGANQDLKNAARELQTQWRNMAARSSPEQAKLFENADDAYSGLLRLSDATFRSSTDMGEFTPAQLFSSAKKLAPSKRSLNQQTAPFLRDAMEAQNILGNVVPNSGTVDRLLTASGLGTVALGAMQPSALIAPAIGAAMYTKPLNRALTAGITSRPRAAIPLAEAMRASSPLIGLGASKTTE